MSRILIAYYSSYGHTFEMAKAVVEGVEEAGREAVLRRVPELDEAHKAISSQWRIEAQMPIAIFRRSTHHDLRAADGVIFGTPTRYGNVTAQLKDTTGGLWQQGELEDKELFTAEGLGGSPSGSGHDCRPGRPPRAGIGRASGLIGFISLGSAERVETTFHAKT